MLLIDLPDEADGPVSLEDFVDIQERHVREMTGILMSKSQEIEMAVNDMLGIIVEYPLDSHVRGVSESEIIKVKAHYNWSMYQALLTSTKRSLSYLKKRLSVRDNNGCPFFEVDVQLDGQDVRVRPTIDDLQQAVNGGAQAILKCSKMIEAWDTVTIPKNVQLILNPNLPPVLGTGSQGTFYDRVAQDKEILKVILLLTGSIQSTREAVEEHCQSFANFQWLWRDIIADRYKTFQQTQPTLDEFEAQLKMSLQGKQCADFLASELASNEDEEAGFRQPWCAVVKMSDGKMPRTVQCGRGEWQKLHFASVMSGVCMCHHGFLQVRCVR